ncbi:MAG: helix-turn-helix transcriptional regulator [Lawsonibacter sp.]|nr:helix-turn-helix transcriptional regulator [Lawsonibacter sp.]
MEFYERIRLLRKERGLTQKEAAAELGVSYRAYQCYEYNQRCPDLPGLIAIAHYFDVSLDYLVGQSEVRERR